MKSTHTDNRTVEQNVLQIMSISNQTFNQFMQSATTTVPVNIQEQPTVRQSEQPGLTVNSASFTMMWDPWTGGQATKDTLESLVAILGWYDEATAFEKIPDSKNPLTDIGHRARFPTARGSLSWCRVQHGKLVLPASPQVVRAWTEQLARYVKTREVKKNVKEAAAPDQAMGKQAALDRVRMAPAHVRF